MELKFFLSCEPPKATAQQKKVFTLRNGKKRGVDPENVQEARKFFCLHLRQYRPTKPLKGPIQLTLIFNWSFLKGDSKGVRANGWRWKTTSPDFDNLSKIITDTMTNLGFWGDDGEIALGTIGKRHSDKPGVHVVAKELKQPYEL